MIAAGSAILTGCATQSKTTFWERKGDNILVHHFDGSNDHVETLSTKKLPSDALKPDSFPKGQYFAVGQKDFQVKKTAVPHSSAKDNASESGKLAAANKELRSLCNRLNEAEAENQRLPAQIAKPSDNPSVSAYDCLRECYPDFRRVSKSEPSLEPHAIQAIKKGNL